MESGGYIVEDAWRLRSPYQVMMKHVYQLWMMRTTVRLMVNQINRVEMMMKRISGSLQKLLKKKVSLLYQHFGEASDRAKFLPTPADIYGIMRTGRNVMDITKNRHKIASAKHRHVNCLVLRTN